MKEKARLFRCFFKGNRVPPRACLCGAERRKGRPVGRPLVLVRSRPSFGQALVDFHFPVEPVRQLRGAVPRQGPPAPVSAQGGGGVDPALTAQAQQVLKLHHRQVRRGGPGGAHHAPVVALLFIEAEIGFRQLHVLRRGGGHPAQDGVVVVGAGVGHAVGGVAVGEVASAGVPAVEGELQHLHAGVTRLLQQLPDGGGEEAQVLGDDVPGAQGRLHGPEKADAGAGPPMAVPGGSVPGGDGVVLVKAPEVVDPQGVVELELGGDAANPPAVAVGLHGLPVEKGVSPQLSIGGEAIRRTARHLRGPPAGVQLKLLGAGPDVGAVNGDVDGQVPDDGDAFFVGIFLQAPPLAEKEELYPGPEVDFSGQLLPGPLQGGGAAKAQLLRPLQPGSSVIPVLQGHEQGVVLQPVRLPEDAPQLE